MLSLIPLLPLLISLPLSAQAHFHGTSAEHAARDAYEHTVKRAYASTCAPHLAARGMHDQSAERRAAWANEIRRSRGLPVLGEGNDVLRKRQVASVSESHQVNDTGYAVTDSPFASNYSGCVLQPEVTQGPYYVAGELIRANVTDGQQGVPLYADFQVLDVATCEPVTGLYLDFWHANATGVYSGVVESGNGDSSDETNLNNTALRGIQATNTDGYAQFVSVFPGYYTGRAVHIHIMVHQTDGTLGSNSTYLGGTVSHAGQVFFDQDLITQVNTLSPYSENTNQLTENTGDNILSGVWDTFDPYMEYTLLGDSLEDGILAWTTLVINTTRSDALSIAATYTEDGGVESESSGMGGSGGGGGGGMGGSGAPSGTGGGASNVTASGRGRAGDASVSAVSTISRISGSAAAAAAVSASSSASAAMRRVRMSPASSVLAAVRRMFGA